jgi:hypothetical protein
LHVSPKSIVAGVKFAWIAAERSDQRWIGDTTDFVVGENGTRYLAVLHDFSSRSVQGESHKANRAG